MKKLLGIILATGLTLGVSSNTTKTASAIEYLGVVSSLLNTVPQLATDIPAFPGKIKEKAKELKAGYNSALAMPVGPERDKKVQELFVKATAILIEINNIFDNFLLVAKSIQPMVSGIDQSAGQKYNEVINLIANTMFYISTITKGQARIVAGEIGVTPISAELKPSKPNENQFPDDL